MESDDLDGGDDDENEFSSGPGSDGDDGGSDEDQKSSQPKPSRATREKLSQDDAEIKDLERKLEEQIDHVAMAEERMRKAEGHVQECQIELGKIRVENSELDRLNVSTHINSAFIPLIDG